MTGTHTTEPRQEEPRPAPPPRNGRNAPHFSPRAPPPPRIAPSDSDTPACDSDGPRQGRQHVRDLTTTRRREWARKDEGGRVRVDNILAVGNEKFPHAIDLLRNFQVQCCNILRLCLRNSLRVFHRFPSLHYQYCCQAQAPNCSEK